MTVKPAVAFRTFQPGDEVPFRELNEAWIEKFFVLEKPDLQVLSDPVGYILKPGGQIVMAIGDGEPVGCCALLAMPDGVFEVAKMTVREDHQGRGIGKQLLRAVIECGKAAGARSLYLETSKKLGNAIHVYESLGFRHLPPERVHPSPYNRADVFMELVFG
jgi:putative acetyltransferase